MKRIIQCLTLCLLLTTIGFAGKAQFRKIPEDVTEAFRKKFPNATKVSWKDKLSSFQASFEMDDEEYIAYFASSGDWQETDQKMEYEDLPDDVQDGFEKSKYTDWEKGDIYMIVKADDENLLSYRIAVKKNAIQKKYLFFANDGTLLRDAITL
ncbi:PepSY-like domain-containing protein [Deminuibacter soli]|uniref:Putative beta-lactamase-inhibitor-like PepSY-like domain-containing protein n=1 Tax=Deminuibacter soli TaxID=2291815 RepID=A0A3E1NKX0_9BACT|nr:PepSY-like domain-containing protein [Deminuibacter soli]RFM28438.1 hypothetical protein DXN05_06405 [Deminuibacter soli]